LAVALALGLSPFFFGYYDAAIWVPAGLGLVLVATAGAIARPPRLGAPAWLILSGLAGLALVSLSSATWTESVEQAVLDGNRWLGYLVLTGALLVLVRNRSAALWLLGGLAAVALGVAAVVIARMLGGDADLFLSGRLHEPLGYINGQGCFFLLAVWPCLALAERSRSSLAAGGGMAAAVVLGGLALLSQSRGVGLAAGLSAVVVLAAVPGRQRRAWALLTLGAGLLLAGTGLLDVYREGHDGALPGAVLRDAASLLMLAAVAAGVLWGTVTLGADRLAAAVPAARRASTVALTLVALIGFAAGVANAGRLADALDRQYTAFVRLDAEAPAQGGASVATRLVSGAGNRYDYWRVALRAWREHPIGGVGAGNFDQAWFAERSIAEDVRQPHSVEMQVLSELGLLGLACLLLLFAGLGWGAWRTARAAGTSPAAQALAVAGLGIVAAWLVHTSVDWIHLLPGVTALALAAAVGLVHEPASTAASRPVRRPRQRRAIIPAVAVAAMLAVAAVSLARQGMSDYFRRQAQGALARDPATALRDIDRSLRLDGEAVDSYYIKAAALARFDRGQAARRALLAARDREPRNFLTWALLGDLSVRMGAIDDARRFYRRALRLNPREPSLRELARNPAGVS
jgi:tetratricopeptide (TPR) repeat protein